MTIIEKLVFFFTKRQHIVTLEQGGSPLIIFRNRREYTMDGYLVDAKNLQIDENSIRRIDSHSEVEGEIPESMVIQAVISDMRYHHIEVELASEKFSQARSEIN